MKAGGRRIAVVTGGRSEYGILRTVLQGLAGQRRVTLQLAVTGMHLLKQFGHTVDEIVADGWRVDARVRMQAGDDGPLDQARGLAAGVRGLAEYFAKAKTDIVVVLGDRIEAMAGALAAVTTGRVVAHLHGGDVASGDIDEGLRHAITKLAHVHLVATADARRRVIRMGEPAERVHQVGAPGLDRLRELMETGIEPASMSRRAGGPGLAVVAQHAYGRPADVEQRVMTNILAAVGRAGLRRLIVFPNTDRGHKGVLRAIRAHQRAAPGDAVEVVASLPRDEFLRTLAGADVLIGNSSAGIVEAPFAGTPSVNVGERQAGRQRGGSSVIASGESQAAIARALAEALRRRLWRGGRNVYGDGRAGRRIAEILARLKLSPALTRKRITY